MAKRSRTALTQFLIILLVCWGLYGLASQVDFWMLHTDAILNTMPDWLNRHSLMASGIYASVIAAILALISLASDRSSRNVIILAATSTLVVVQLSMPFALYKFGSPRTEPVIEARQ